MSRGCSCCTATTRRQWPCAQPTSTADVFSLRYLLSCLLPTQTLTPKKPFAALSPHQRLWLAAAAVPVQQGGGGPAHSLPQQPPPGGRVPHRGRAGHPRPRVRHPAEQDPEHGPALPAQGGQAAPAGEHPCEFGCCGHHLHLKHAQCGQLGQAGTGMTLPWHAWQRVCFASLQHGA